MKMRALDSFYSSETGQAHAGQEFEIDSADRGREFAKRGLAEILEESDMAETKPTETKKDPAPQNKAQPAPANKAAPAPSAKVGKA